MRRLAMGFIPLTDAAVLIAAAERGFSMAEGLEIDLHKEVSWANIRDKVNVGLLDGAHMLGPLAIASSLGLGHVRVPLVVPFALNLNGSAVTIAKDVYAEMGDTGIDLSTAPAAARALGRVVAQRRAAGREPLIFASVYSFSTHTYLVRNFLKAGGVDPDRDVRLVVIPPPFMAESLRNGLVHGFCVGSPWNSVAVDADVGRIAVLGAEIFGWVPEKVLGVHARFANAESDVLHRLVRALYAAARWCEDPANHEDLARLLGEPRHLSLPADVLRRTLDGRLHTARGGPLRAHQDYLVLHRDGANRPEPDHALWMYSQIVEAHQGEWAPDAAREAISVYRPDIFDHAVGHAPVHHTAEPDCVATRLGAPFDAARFLKSGPDDASKG
ncbi:MAG: nitrate transporter [Rhizobiales bacterium 24-66-13]|nr:MAG: nitrate transporter [Rhizobiales bacterium 35-66-30]OYZ73915.1 MAG: nitrate transporter [Rhizobiales bacterium 24-66-13]OZB02469.1 MAG: nitrate transporter [Rhizobiales bacterium 39-66-18]HQS11188.1 CmpA/NrtA family ABC transporter substrate-binding protein [Xanthobacteraceae bacterium]HQS45393.1 CmpA/NrtA family ABC transporter substrate-binding protein [Xanthobacteraceae bacterium]